jgi:riboflavin synthase
MFTGIVDDVGTIEAVRDGSLGRELEIACDYGDLTIGESIACAGACLTVRSCAPRRFAVAAVVTTRERTTVGEWQVGRRINLERAMLATSRFGGHIVQGHVDAVGEVVDRRMVADALLIDIAAPPPVHELLILHGSVAVDGVSLTVNALEPSRTFQVSIIDHTLRHTTLGELERGDRLHLEADIVGKYVRRLVRHTAGAPE